MFLLCTLGNNVMYCSLSISENGPAYLTCHVLINKKKESSTLWIPLELQKIVENLFSPTYLWLVNVDLWNKALQKHVIRFFLFP